MDYKEKVWQDPVKDRYLDFTDCTTLGEVHLLIKEVLELPDFYGENLSALWDSLTGIMYVPANITIKKSSTKSLNSEMDEIIGIFNRAKKLYGEIILTVLDAD